MARVSFIIVLLVIVYNQALSQDTSPYKVNQSYVTAGVAKSNIPGAYPILLQLVVVTKKNFLLGINLSRIGLYNKDFPREGFLNLGIPYPNYHPVINEAGLAFGKNIIVKRNIHVKAAVGPSFVNYGYPVKQPCQSYFCLIDRYQLEHQNLLGINSTLEMQVLFNEITGINFGIFYNYNDIKGYGGIFTRFSFGVLK